jgi:hypothetical protein
MAEIAAGAPSRPVDSAGPPDQAAELVGESSFSDLVRAHFRREQERESLGTASDAAEEEYRTSLARFENQAGDVASAYWSTRQASAVALTVKCSGRRRHPFVELEAEVRLHRVTDWVTKNAEPVADLLHRCDLLAIRVGELLRGTSERIAMQWIYSIQEHVLGYIERNERRDTAKERQFVHAQERELAKVEHYYLRAGAKSGRIVYVAGMTVGALAVVAICALASIGLALAHDYGGMQAQLLALCTGAGAVGALVSVLSRMGSYGGTFTVDFEVGRPLLRRLGLYKPFVGAVFGVATYFLLASGLLQTKPVAKAGDVIYFYGVVAFLAGFSERFTGVIFGQAEQMITAQGSAAAPPADEADQQQPEAST